MSNENVNVAWQTGSPPRDGSDILAEFHEGYIAVCYWRLRAHSDEDGEWRIISPHYDVLWSMEHDPERWIKIADLKRMK